METAKPITSPISPRDMSKSRIVVVHDLNLVWRRSFPMDLYVHILRKMLSYHFVHGTNTSKVSLLFNISAGNIFMFTAPQE